MLGSCVCFSFDSLVCVVVSALVCDCFVLVWMLVFGWWLYLLVSWLRCFGFSFEGFVNSVGMRIFVFVMCFNIWFSGFVLVFDLCFRSFCVV